MTAKHILHMLSPAKHSSPFDINMALDAGFDSVTPYINVTLDDVVPLVQDAMFSRPPSHAVRTGIFFGGKDAILALDMLAAAKGALLAPFEISLFADPAGSFTTAAAMVACVEKLLKGAGWRLAGLKIVVFGATGVVGFSAAVIAALEGAEVILAGHDGAVRVGKSADEILKRFGVKTIAADARTETLKNTLLANAEAVMCAGKAGVRILDAGQIAAAKHLLIAADVNAVPPAGIEGLGLMDKGTRFGGSAVMGLGPLAIGNVKYQTEAGLFRQMCKATSAQCYDFRDAFKLARQLA